MRPISCSNRNAFTSLPNDKSLYFTKFRTFEDDRLNEDQMKISVFDRVEKTVRKEENAGYQHFLLFPQSFLKAFLSRFVKSRDCGVKG